MRRDVTARPEAKAAGEICCIGVLPLPTTAGLVAKGRKEERRNRMTDIGAARMTGGGDDGDMGRAVPG